MGQLLAETKRAKAGRKPLVEIIGNTLLPIPHPKDRLDLFIKV